MLIYIKKVEHYKAFYNLFAYIEMCKEILRFEDIENEKKCFTYVKLLICGKM